VTRVGEEISCVSPNELVIGRKRERESKRERYNDNDIDNFLLWRVKHKQKLFPVRPLLQRGRKCLCIFVLERNTICFIVIFFLKKGCPPENSYFVFAFFISSVFWCFLVFMCEREGELVCACKLVCKWVCIYV
jgi:hypothetical protein